jgi:P4 family phage/plasmid primase-like protien
MEQGGNVGIAGTADDPLVNVDIDDEDQTDIEDLKPTLIGRSRSRTGIHAWYMAADGEEIPNIPTDDAGEVRASWQYVVAPGSYVETDPADVPPDQQEWAGYYTVERGDPVATITIEELPEVFQTQAAPTEPAEEAVESMPEAPIRDSGSALWEVTATDVLRGEGYSAHHTDRFPAIWHGSDTGANMSISEDGEFLTCWRHSVSHNGLMALITLSDHPATCEQMGEGHKGGSGPSSLHRDRESAIWHAWTYAKDRRYIPEDDPIPYAAVLHLVREHELAAPTEIPKSRDESLPRVVWEAALNVVEKLGYDHGRDDQLGSTKSEATPPEELDGWGQIRKEADENPSDQTDARWAAVQLLLEEMDLITVDESLEIYWYDPSCGYWLPRGENEIARRLTEHLGGHITTYWLRETINNINNITSQPFEEAFKTTEEAICLSNGVLELDGDQPTLREHRPEDRFLGGLSVEWDPEAEAPRWEAFLEEATDQTARQQLQEFVGYCLHHWGLPIHRSLWIVGPTASGKSTALNVIGEMFGDAGAVSLAPQQMVKRFGGAELLGALVNIRSDIPESTLGDTGMFKSIIAGDQLMAERKGKDPFFFRPKAKHIYSANTLPDVRLDDDSFFRRVLLIAFPHTVPSHERQRDLTQQLLGELPGILRWAVDGYYRLMEQGDFTGQIGLGEAMEKWAMWSNTVDRFAQRVITVDANASPIPKSDLYAIYSAWCGNYKMPAEQQRSFTQRLKQRHEVEDGKATVDGRQQRCYLNVSVPDEAWDLLDATGDTTQRDLSDH